MKHLSKETRTRMSEAHKGKHFSKEHKRRIGIALGGNKKSKETKTRMSNAVKEVWIRPGHKEKMSKIQSKIKRGSHNPFFGHKYSEETKIKMSEKAKIHVGIKAPNWQGGKSFEIYSVDWTRTLKVSIRERDKHVCQLCSKKQGDMALDVHHIDYNKKNCDPKNLISLCGSCHMRTNFERKYWQNYFEVRMERRFGK